MICVSGGHYDQARGAHYDGFAEYPETLIWADLIVTNLTLLGIDACVVPSGGLRDKVDWINEVRPRATAAVEIHFNADGKHKGKGCETLYYPGSRKGLQLAEEIQRQISTFFPPNRGTKEGWYRMVKGGTADYFLAKTRCPAVIIEPEFIHNKSAITTNQDIGCLIIAEAVAAVVKEW